MERRDLGRGQPAIGPIKFRIYSSHGIRAKTGSCKCFVRPASSWPVMNFVAVDVILFFSDRVSSARCSGGKTCVKPRQRTGAHVALSEGVMINGLAVAWASANSRNSAASVLHCRLGL